MVAFFVFASGYSNAQEEGVPNYAYAVFTGTGKYQIEDRNIYIFRLPLEFTVGEFQSASGNGVDVNLLLPVAVGVTDFKDIEDLPELSLDTINSLSVAPGIELSIPVRDNWRVKPFAHAGLGFDTKSDAETFIWGTGIRTSTSLGARKEWKLGGEFLWAGNSPKGDEPNNSFARWGLGAEYTLPFSWQLKNQEVSWNIRLIHWKFTNAVNFEPPHEKFKLEEATEIGFSFSLSKPLRILGYDFKQGGVGFEKSNDYEAIVLYASFPF
jgi:hypothetical protein